MAEHIPAITLTDPHNRDGAPVPAQSPARDSPAPQLPAASELGHGWVGAARPRTPNNPSRSGLTGRAPPETGSPSWSSPGKLIRSLSNNASAMSSNTALSARESSNNSTSEASMPAMDPLSQHIMNRTNGVPTLASPPPGRPRTADPSPVRETSPDDDRESRLSREMPPPPRPDSMDAHRDLRKGVKAVSFLSRLMHKSKKTETGEQEPMDDESVSNDGRPEGNDATVFAQTSDNMGHNPRHPQPPGYIKVRSKHKKTRDFDRLFLAQELYCKRSKGQDAKTTTNKLRRKSSATAEPDTVWAMEFSKDGRHMAAAGADMVLRVWKVLSSSDDRQKHETHEASENEANGVGAHTEHLSAPVFQGKPVREYEGHTSTILDISWSKNNFILSSSMDKTVRLWHVSRSECLCTFQHTDFVPSIAFHPKDDRFFLAGSLDAKLRLWSIPDKSVAFSAQAPDMITAVAFTPDGKYVVAGCLSGLVIFYTTEGLKYQTQIHVRSTRGSNVKGSKITGIQAHVAASGEMKILVTSNDSRIRLYNFRDKSLELKFKGNANNSSQIRATLSEDGRYVVCGSEDRKAYIWSLGPAEGEKRDKRPVEMFEAHDTITTSVCFAPSRTRALLSRSEDPVYDLCNPPPVMLLSRSEHGGSMSSRAPTENGSIQATPVDFDRPKESPAYVARSAHKNGNIVVTADYTGRIKVFRQDCAWPKRRQDEWDRSSLFGKRSGGKLSRTGSLATKTSQRSLREQSLPRSSTSTQPSDRILSWRQGIGSTPSISSRRSMSKQSATRSSSPNALTRQRSNPPLEPLTSMTNQTNGNATSAPDVSKPTTSTRARGDSQTSDPRVQTPTNPNGDEASFATPPSSRSSTHRNEDNPLLLEGGRSMVFWDKERWKGKLEHMKKSRQQDHNILSPVRSAEEGPMAEENGHLAVRPRVERAESVVSKLSDERSNSMVGSEVSGESGERHSADRRRSAVSDEDDDDEDDVFDDAVEG